MAFSIVTGNGFAGNAQRADNINSQEFIYSTFAFATNTYNLTFKYRSNIPLRVLFGDPDNYPWTDIAVCPVNTGTAAYYTVNGINASSYGGTYLGFTSNTDNIDGTSSTSMTIPTSHPTTVNFTTQTGLDLLAGMNIIVQASGWFSGTITSYDSGTGAVVLSSTANGGGGTYNSWNIYPDNGWWFEIDEVNLVQV